MKKNEKRISLIHGTAIVDKNIKPEVVESLNKLVECAYNQIKSVGKNN